MTVQAPDVLVYEGRQWHLMGAPLVPYAEKHRIGFSVPNTALWRGHVARWLVEGKCLKLIGIEGRFSDGRLATVSDIFGEPGPIVASWFSGEFRAGRGEMLQGGYNAKWAVERTFEIRDGVVLMLREELSWE